MANNQGDDLPVTMLWFALYAFLALWSFEAVYVLWQAYRNDALPKQYPWNRSKISR
jgi:hypothetical protein